MTDHTQTELDDASEAGDSRLEQYDSITIQPAESDDGETATTDDAVSMGEEFLAGFESQPTPEAVDADVVDAPTSDRTEQEAIAADAVDVAEVAKRFDDATESLIETMEAQTQTESERA